MKKYLKIIMASFVFLIGFGMFAGTALAIPMETGSLKTYKGGGKCLITTYYTDTYTAADGTIKTYTFFTYEAGSTTYSNGKIDCISNGTAPTKEITVNMSVDDQGNPIPFTEVGPAYGDRNSNDVRMMQVAMLNDGINIKVDGNFGSKTRKQLMTYQAQNNLPKTGIFDVETRASMTYKILNLGSENRNNPEQQIPTDVLSLKETTSKIDMLKKEIASITNTLSKLAQQASAIGSVKN